MTDSVPSSSSRLGRFLAFFIRHKLIAVLILLFLALTLYRLATLKSADFSASFEAEPVYVELVQANYGTIRDLGLYYGTLSAPSKYTLASKVGGEVNELLADIGDRLVNGDVVAILDNEEYTLARDRAALNVSLVEAQHVEAMANLDFARNDMARQANLTQKSIVTQAEFETAENRLKQAEARMAVAASQLEAARNSLADAELRLSYTRIVASWPMDNDTVSYRYVGARLVNVGDLIASNTPIFELVSLDPLLVVVEIIEKDYPKVHVGMEVSIRTEAYGKETFKGVVKRIAPVLSADSRQARVEMEVANPGLRLKPGMFAEVIFVFDERRGVWSVAQDVPFRRNDGYVIFIADPVTQTVSELKVELGLREGDRVELIDATNINGPVVALGQHLLQDGQPYRLPGDNTRPASSRETAPSPGSGKMES